MTAAVVLIVLAYLGVGLLFDRWLGPASSNLFERGSAVIFGPAILLAISPFLFIGLVAEKIWGPVK